MTTVNENQAQQVTMRTEMTFAEYKDFIFQQRYPIRYREVKDEFDNVIKPGEPIEVKPDSFNSVLFLRLKRAGTPQEFEMLMLAVMTIIEQWETQNLLPKEWVEDIATPFDLTPKAVPDKFADEIGEDMEVKIFLDGELRYRLERVAIPQPIEEEEEEPEE